MADKTLVKNAADEEQVHKAAKSEKDREEQEVRDFQWLLADARGRRIFWGLLAATNTLKSAHFDNQSQQAYYDGVQSVGRAYLKLLTDVAPEAYGKMAKEAKDGE